jgi:phytanoyl-CoA hydroxylase
MKQISEQKKEEFKKNGYVMFENILNKNELKSINKNIKNIFKGKYSTSVVPDKIKWKFGRDNNNIPRSLCNVWKSDKSVAKIVLNNKIAKIAGLLMKWQSTRLNQDSIIWVVPNAGCVNYHQDDPYQDWHTPGGVITCWIPTTDTNYKSASLEYLVGSHNKKISQRRDKFYAKKDYRSIIKKYLKYNSIATMKMKAGSIVFHHGRTWHGSGYNRTKKDRIAISIHFMNGNSKFHSSIKSPYFNHYKIFNSLKMEESFFPITWSKNNKISKFIKNYLNKK